MTSRARRLLLLPLVLVLALPVVGRLGPAARAEEPEMPALPISLDDIELLPVRELEWGLLLREHPDLVKQLMFHGKRLERIHGHLKAREDPTDAGSRKLRGEIARIANALAPHLQDLLDAIEPLGIDADVLRVLDHAPPKPMRKERHALRLVRLLPDLDARQQRLFAQLVPAAEAALLTLHANRARLEDADTAIRGLQKRFWQVVDPALDLEQRIWVRRRLPGDLAKHADLFGHLYTLPGLEIPQASRLKALLVRLQAEAAPDEAAVKRAEARLAEAALPRVERRRIRAEKEAAEKRNLDRMVETWRKGRSVLSARQVQELDSILPYLTAQDRPGDLEAVLKEIGLTADQHGLLADLHRRYGPLKGRLQQDLAVVELRMREYGPDSPQREMMDVMRAQAYAAALVEARRAARELYLDVLTPEQVSGWVLGVPKPD